MVQIAINKYECEWCGEKIDWIKKTEGLPKNRAKNTIQSNHLSSGHSRVSNQLICPNSNCRRYVSQKPWGERR